MHYFLGLDIGSSSVKVALVNASDGTHIGVVQQPETEMAIDAPQAGWAEQHPEDWWYHVCKGISKIKTAYDISEKDIVGIGIAYQMHGLVLVDDKGHVLQKSIIWCDGRAVKIGEQTLLGLGDDYCKQHLLNAPGNFTASKLRWVLENEPENYRRISKFMLPGDYIAYRLSGSINSTISGMSEGIFWDFKNNRISEELMDYLDIERHMVPELVNTFSVQSLVSNQGAKESGLMEGTPILYRAGDQPNNALALNVLNTGEVAATGGTSGVMYAVTGNLQVEEYDKVNNFAHVNYDFKSEPKIGKLLCINGAGIQYRWLLNHLSVGSYEEMNQLASEVEVGSDGVSILPFGNGPERIFKNKDIGTRIVNLNLNRHHKGHLCRAALEGIAFAFVHGFEIMQNDGIVPKVIRAGNDNLFRSAIFSTTIATLIRKEIDIYDTTGAVGAARACIIHSCGYQEFSSFVGNDYSMTYVPNIKKEPYIKAYGLWKEELYRIIKNETH